MPSQPQKRLYQGESQVIQSQGRSWITVTIRTQPSRQKEWEMAVVVVPSTNDHRPRGLTFRWWGCCRSCLWYKPTELAHFFFIFHSCVCVCLYGPFNCISFHKFSRQFTLRFLSLFFRSCFCLIGLFQLYLFMKVSLCPDIILCGWLGLIKSPSN